MEETKLNFSPKARFKKVKIVILIIWKLKEFREMGEFWPNEENQVWVGDFNDEACKSKWCQLGVIAGSDGQLNWPWLVNFCHFVQFV